MTSYFVMPTDFLLMKTPLTFLLLTNFWACSQITCTHSNLWLPRCNWTDSMMQLTRQIQTLILQCCHHFVFTYHRSKIIRKQKWRVTFCMKFKLTFIFLSFCGLLFLELTMLIQCRQWIQNSLCWQCDSNIQVIWRSASHFSFNSFSKTRKECAASSKKNVGIKVWLCFWRAYWNAVANSFWNSHLRYAQIWRMEKDLRHCKPFIVQAQNLLLHIQNKCISSKHCVTVIKIIKHWKTSNYLPSNMLIYVRYSACK